MSCKTKNAAFNLLWWAYNRKREESKGNEAVAKIALTAARVSQIAAEIAVEKYKAKMRERWTDDQDRL